MPSLLCREKGRGPRNTENLGGQLAWGPVRAARFLTRV